MKYYNTFIWLSFALADLSIIVGILTKLFGFGIFGLGRYSFFSFSGLCLLYAIALSLTQIAYQVKK